MPAVRPALARQRVVDAGGPYQGDVAGASAAISGVMTRGRPKTLPRARAAAMPARVRSRMMSRSSSAKAAITVNDILHRAAEAVELPDGEGVTRPEDRHRGLESGTVGTAGGDMLLEDLRAAGAAEHVELELGVLGVGGDASEADDGG